MRRPTVEPVSGTAPSAVAALSKKVMLIGNPLFPSKPTLSTVVPFTTTGPAPITLSLKICKLGPFPLFPRVRLPPVFRRADSGAATPLNLIHTVNNRSRTQTDRRFAFFTKNLVSYYSSLETTERSSRKRGEFQNARARKETYFHIGMTVWLIASCSETIALPNFVRATFTLFGSQFRREWPGLRSWGLANQSFFYAASRARGDLCETPWFHVRSIWFLCLTPLMTL